MFKKRKGMRLPYNEQGLVYFVCINFKKMPNEIQTKIFNLCVEIGGEDYQALFEVLTNESKSVNSIALEFYTNEKKLYKMRKKFYERFITG